MPSKTLLIVHEAAELLKMGESTVRPWVNDSQFHVINFGRHWRISQRDLKGYLIAHTNRAPDNENDPAKLPLHGPNNDR